MINQVVLVGRTTKDIQLAYTTNNKAYAKFTLAVNRLFKDGQGNQQADFIRIVVWNKQAENAAKFVKKGDLIGVTGRIETGSYDDNGITRYTTDVLASSITFLESKKQQSQAQQTQERILIRMILVFQHHQLLIITIHLIQQLHEQDKLRMSH